ncbi:MAG: ABC transporter ATP-binding protein, partial [Hyphomonas sp.]
EELCDTIAIVDKGAIVACEPTAKLLSRLDYKTLIITPREPITTIPEELAMHDPKLRPDGTITITFKTAETGIGRLLEKARAAGISVADLSTKSPDLEDVFISLTSDRAVMPATG